MSLMAWVYIFETGSSTWRTVGVEDAARIGRPCAGRARRRIKLGAKLFRQMQLFFEVLNDVLEFREIFRGRLDQGLVSFQHRQRPSGAVFFRRCWKSLPVLFYGARAYVEKLVQPQAPE